MKREAVTLAPRFAGADHRVFVGLTLDDAGAIVGVHVDAATDGSPRSSWRSVPCRVWRRAYLRGDAARERLFADLDAIFAHVTRSRS